MTRVPVNRPRLRSADRRHRPARSCSETRDLHVLRSGNSCSAKHEFEMNLALQKGVTSRLLALSRSPPPGSKLRSRAPGRRTHDRGFDAVINRIAKSALYGASCLTLFAMAQEARAQQPPPPADATTTDSCINSAGVNICGNASADTIIVTGSHLRTPNLESANPIAVVTGEQIFD